MDSGHNENKIDMHDLGQSKKESENWISGL
jgi:hypothetical protein